MVTSSSFDSTVQTAAPPEPVQSGSWLESTGLAAVYALSIFVSAFLLFQVQPLIGKVILPWFGGTPSVWTTCMLFFQLLLFGGYAYAHFVSSHLRPRMQACVHFALLVAGCAALPIVPNESWKPIGTEEPTFQIIRLLLASVGLPFFVLSSTGPLLQGWFSRTHAGRSPYRLYALSNVGSLLALISYPFVFDLIFPTALQAWLWSWGFRAFAVLCGFCAIGLASRAVGAVPQLVPERSLAGVELSEEAPSFGRRVLWFALAMVPSALLLATTNQVCLDVASVPFLWVLPLTLYLLSFILCFDGERWYSRPFMMPAAALSLAALFPVLEAGAKVSIGVQAAGYFLALFACAMVCHGELVRLKPHVRHLTSFYLLISAGGAAGGIFVAVIAPLIFSNYFELHATLLACAVLMVVVLVADSSSRCYRARAQWTCGAMVLAVGAYGGALAYNAAEQSRGVVAAKRNFYGVLRVQNSSMEFGADRDAVEQPYRELLNGRILHGLEFLDPKLRDVPTTYYAPPSGIGRLLSDSPGRKRRRVGLVGLGVGTLAAYARPGDQFRFYEINKAVPEIAYKYFHFLSDCRGAVEIIPGDARLTLDREQPQNFDVLALDAFSGDAIPMHLLTVEAFAVYLKHLGPAGVVAVHISNKHFLLQPVVEAVAEAHRLAHAVVNASNDVRGGFDNTWVLVARDKKSLDVDDVLRVAGPPGEARVLWTDDRSSMFEVLREREVVLQWWRKFTARFRRDAQPQ